MAEVCSGNAYRVIGPHVGLTLSTRLHMQHVMIDPEKSPLASKYPLRLVSSLSASVLDTRSYARRRMPSFEFRIESFDSVHGAHPCHLYVFPISSPHLPPHLYRGEIRERALFSPISIHPERAKHCFSSSQLQADIINHVVAYPPYAPTHLPSRSCFSP